MTSRAFDLARIRFLVLDVDGILTDGSLYLSDDGTAMKRFAIIDGAGTDAKGNDLKLPNVESLFFKEQDAGAMVGVIAGMMEKDKLTPGKTNVISAVGGVSIPPVNHYIAGY